MFIPKASAILTKYTGIFDSKDFELAGVEAKLRELSRKSNKENRAKEAKIIVINQCVGILVNLAEHITKDFLDRLEKLFKGLDSNVDYARVLMEVIALSFKFQENNSKSFLVYLNSNQLNRTI